MYTLVDCVINTMAIKAVLSILRRTVIKKLNRLNNNNIISGIILVGIILEFLFSRILLELLA